MAYPSKAATTERSSTRIGFLDLPLEIRVKIYHCLIPRKQVVDVSWPHFLIRWLTDEITHNVKGDHLDLREIPELEEDGSIEVEEGILRTKEDARDLEVNAGYSEDCNQDLSPLIGWNHTKNNNSIFLLSKTISEEALDVLYGDNLFKVVLHGDDEHHLRKNFSEANRRRMQCLLVTAQPRGSGLAGKRPDTALWSSILPQLKSLCLVAEQPAKAAHYWNAPTLTEDMKHWVEWIQPYLQCFGQYLLRDTDVSVDVDGRAETSEMVKKYLPDTYREIKSRQGDLIFKRGAFSWESGYWDDDDHGMGSWDA